MLLSEVASLTGGRLTGDGSVDISSVAEINEAKAGDLVLVLEDRYLADALNSGASAFVLSEKLDPKGRPSVLVKSPRLALAMILKKFAPPPEVMPGIDKMTSIHSSAKLGKTVSVGPFVYIGPDVKVGDGTVIHPNVTIYNNVSIGKRCVIHSGSTIGVDGYGFVPADSELKKIPQIGGVVIEDDVEIYANVCIARGTIGNTVIGAGTKIDNLTHIAHNCKFGKNCAITGLVGFAGSVTFEDNVSVGGQAGFAGHLTVGKNTVVMAKSGVTKDIPPNSIVSGFPAMDHKMDFKIQASLRRLPEALKKIMGK